MCTLIVIHAKTNCHSLCCQIGIVWCEWSVAKTLNFLICNENSHFLLEQDEDIVRLGIGWELNEKK